MKLPLTVLTLLFALFNFSPAFAGEKGREIFIEYGCNKCHSIKALGMTIVESEEEPDEDEDDDDYGEEEREPPDLSDVGLKRDGKFIAKYMRKKVAIEGRKHKKRFKGTKAELKIIRDWLLTLKTPQ